MRFTRTEIYLYFWIYEYKNLATEKYKSFHDFIRSKCDIVSLLKRPLFDSILAVNEIKHASLSVFADRIKVHFIPAIYILTT